MAVIAILESVDFWKFALPLSGAVVAWFVNEWRKRVLEQYQRKEERYRELVHCLRGFYVSAQGPDDLKGKFLDELNLCWLYCPDDVIRKAYAFLETVQAGRNEPDEVKEKAVGEFVSALRNDLLSRRLTRRTSLTAKDFRHLGVSKR
ncbi:MAG: hypothetical protein KGJ55_05370 [Gammaproteobacteria bacterium]|nr:hypothetical protein [Gammaproteobacteria bacterium]